MPRRTKQAGRAGPVSVVIACSVMWGCVASLPLPGGGTGTITGLNADDPRVQMAITGLYLATISGDFNATELLEVRRGSQPDTWLISDITGRGWVVTMPTVSALVVAGPIDGEGTAGGQGTRAARDIFTLNVVEDRTDGAGARQLTIQAVRVPGTDDSFPLQVSGIGGAPTTSGTFAGTVQETDLTRNIVIGTRLLDEISVVVSGSTLQMALDPQPVFAGVFAGGTQIAVRVVADARPGYGTIPGSATSLADDVLGEIRFPSPERLEAVLVVQTRAPFGQREQRLLIVEGERPENSQPEQGGDGQGDAFPFARPR